MRKSEGERGVKRGRDDEESVVIAGEVMGEDGKRKIKKMRSGMR